MFRSKTKLTLNSQNLSVVVCWKGTKQFMKIFANILSYPRLGKVTLCYEVNAHIMTHYLRVY